MKQGSGGATYGQSFELLESSTDRGELGGASGAHQRRDERDVALNTSLRNERTQQGVGSRAYAPGPYSELERGDPVAIWRLDRRAGLRPG